MRDMTNTSSEIEVAAQALAQAQERASELAGALALSAAECERLAERLAAIDHGRVAIVARHQRGEAKALDALDLAALDADRADLAAMIKEAAAARREAEARAAVHQPILAQAAFNLRHAEDEAAEAALVKHADHVADVLQRTIAEIAELHVRLGRARHAWAPSKPLVQALTTLSLRAAL